MGAAAGRAGVVGPGAAAGGPEGTPGPPDGGASGRAAGGDDAPSSGRTVSGPGAAPSGGGSRSGGPAGGRSSLLGFRGSSGVVIPLAWPVHGPLSHMAGILGPMPVASSVRFAAAARRLAAVCAARGLVAPAFRSPPRPPGTDRTLRRRPDGGAVVAVRLRGRPFAAVAADMVEGTLRANSVGGPGCEAHRAALLAAALDDESRAA